MFEELVNFRGLIAPLIVLISMVFYNSELRSQSMDFHVTYIISIFGNGMVMHIKICHIFFQRYRSYCPLVA